MWRQITVLAFLAANALIVGFANAQLVTLAKPVYAEVYLKETSQKQTKITGNLTSYDETLLTLHTGNTERQYNWEDLIPSSAFNLRLRVTDRTSASEMLKLGKFGLSIGAREPAITVLKSAVKIDPNLKTEIDELIAAPPTTAPSVKNEMGLPSQSGVKKPEKTERIKYLPATPEQVTAAMLKARDDAKEVSQKLNVTFAESETDHFIIFTDWNKGEYNFLKTNLELAYKSVSKQFEMSAKDNIFIGKLPVYMFAHYDDFAKYAQNMDDFPVNPNIAGYYTGDTTGVGHLAMWRPDQTLTGTSDINDAKRLWCYVLTHEFTHAFIARYRTNAFIPRWMNEGIAEVVAYSQFPYPEHRVSAKEMAYEGRDLEFLFDSENMPSGEYYPVMQTMVELLISTNRKKFLSMIDTIKDGTDPDEALKQFYNVDKTGLIKTWREWVKRQ